jgi:hypothetical protein
MAADFGAALQEGFVTIPDILSTAIPVSENATAG